MSSRSSNGASCSDSLFLVAGSLGRLWRKHRRTLPTDVRHAYAQLLLELRLEVLPSTDMDAVSNVGRSRYDIRGVSELLKVLASRPNDSVRSTHVTPKVRRVTFADYVETRPADFDMLQCTVNEVQAKWKTEMAQMEQRMAHLQGALDAATTAMVASAETSAASIVSLQRVMSNVFKHVSATHFEEHTPNDSEDDYDDSAEPYPDGTDYVDADSVPMDDDEVKEERDDEEASVPGAWDVLDRNRFAEKDEFETKQKELEGIVNPIMMKVYKASGECSKEHRTNSLLGDAF